MSRFQGRQAKGALRAYRAVLRAEAEHRAASVKHGNTRAHRLGKCTCGERTASEFENVFDANPDN